MQIVLTFYLLPSVFIVFNHNDIMITKVMIKILMTIMIMIRDNDNKVIWR